MDAPAGTIMHVRGGEAEMAAALTDEEPTDQVLRIMLELGATGS